MYIIEISLIITICVFFIINMIDEAILNNNENLNLLYNLEQTKTKTLIEIMHEIRRELRLTQLKECPIEELRNIPKEIIEWIDELDKGTEEICQEENAE